MHAGQNELIHCYQILHEVANCKGVDTGGGGGGGGAFGGLKPPQILGLAL